MTDFFSLLDALLPDTGDDSGWDTDTADNSWDSGSDAGWDSSSDADWDG